MGLRVIGAGVGRTGTYSLKLAIDQLGFGPCHHMEEVLRNKPVQVPLWAAAAQGSPDWPAIYDGYESAVDWPTACFFRELSSAYPDAKFVLTVRSAESWADSFSQTIYRLMATADEAPPHMRAWFDMSVAVVNRTGFPPGLDRQGLIDAFEAHNDAVRSVVPPERLLVFQAREGWGPLCDFLGVAAPDEPFPRSNDRGEFWDLVAAGS